MKLAALVNWGIGREVLAVLHAHPDVELTLVLTCWEESDTDPWRHAVRDCAAQLGIPAFHARDWPDARLAASLQHMDLMVTHAWPRRLPRPVFSGPRRGSVNLHPSLLPRHRGPAPHLQVMQNREQRTGMTCHVIDDGLDTGPIVAQMGFALQPGETIASMLEKQKQLVRPLLHLSLSRLRNPFFRPEPQDDARACYAPRHGRADCA